VGLAHKSGANNTYTYFFHVFSVSVSSTLVGYVIKRFSVNGYRCCYCDTDRQPLPLR
jgi:hypothetical protein